METNNMETHSRSRAEKMPAFDRVVKPKHRLLNWIFTKPIAVGYLLDGLKLAIKGTNIPLLGRIHPFLKPANNYITNLPVNVEVNAQLKAEEVPLPPVVAIELIKRAKHIHVLDKCLCRQGRACKNHSPDIGCLFLGDSGLDVVPQFSRRLTTEEAIEHVQKGLANGLVPSTTRLRADNYAFLFPDRHKVLAMCFCCSCCCFFSYYRHAPTQLVKPIHPWVEGLEIKVTDECNGCGACVDTCYMGAITIEDGRAHHSEKCLGCGRCKTSCPIDAVSIKVTDPDYIHKMVDKFLSIAKID
jgi:UDP-glucose 4-epimerase